jgi:hypothetical protein
MATKTAVRQMTAEAFRSVNAPWSVLIVLMLLGTPLVSASAPRLASGTDLPPLGGTTLSGEALALPHDTRGHPAMLIIGFSKAASMVTRPWLDGCRALAVKSSGASVNCYDIRMVEEVPRVFRGAMERGMRSGLPVGLQRQTLLVYSENDAWRERIGVIDNKTAYVIGCDKEGRVRVTATGEFVESELKRVLTNIEEVPGSGE